MTAWDKNGESDSHRFLIVGESGAGKSTFINYLTNYFEGIFLATKIKRLLTKN
jgi:ABC-type multidrug transport system fused ATPase/permease subunit